jgi:Na+/H+ antiporter NhaC
MRLLNRVRPVAKAVVPAATVAIVPILGMVTLWIGTGAFSVWAFRAALAALFSAIVQGVVTFFVPNSPAANPPDNQATVVWTAPLDWPPKP